MRTDGFDPPQINSALALIIQDFNELSTERQIGMAVGPIPRSAIDRWTEGWPQDDAEAFLICIRALDAVYLEKPKDEPDDAGSANPARDAFRASSRKGGQ